MNLEKYAMVESAALHLKDANDELMFADGADGKPDPGKPMRVHVYGPGSKQFQRASAIRNSKFVERLKKKGKGDATPEEQAREQTEFLSSITKAFENIAGDGLVSDAEVFAKVYSDLSLSFIAMQVGAFAPDTANFSKGSSTN